MPKYEELDPDFKEALIRKAKVRSPFWSLLDMELVDVKKGWAKVRVPFSPHLTNAVGVVHGGAIFSAADSAVGVALVGLLNRGETLATVEMKINYLKPVDDGEIFVEAQIIHKGTITAIGEVDVKDAEGSLIAKALATYMVIPLRKKGL